MWTRSMKVGMNWTRKHQLPFPFPCWFCKHSSDWSNYSQRSELPGCSSDASFQYADQWDTSDFTHGRLFSAILISVVPPGCSSINRKSMERLDWPHSCFHSDAERGSTSAPKTSRPKKRIFDRSAFNLMLVSTNWSHTHFLLWNHTSLLLKITARFYQSLRFTRIKHAITGKKTIST